MKYLEKKKSFSETNQNFCLKLFLLYIYIMFILLCP